MRIVCLSLFFSGDDTVVFLHSVDVGYVLMIETFFWLTMSTPRNGFSKHQRAEKVCGQGGPNWILIAGGALLSTLSIRFGYKLKQSPLFKPPHQSNASPGFKGTCFNSLRCCFFTCFVSWWKLVVQPMEHLRGKDVVVCTPPPRLPVQRIMVIPASAPFQVCLGTIAQRFHFVFMIAVCCNCRCFSC